MAGVPAVLSLREEAWPDHARLLYRVEAALAISLDYTATLKAIGWLIVPQLADWCFVDVFGEDGQMQRVGVAHSDPGHARLADIFMRYPARGLPGQPSSTALAGESIRGEMTHAVIERTAWNLEHANAMRASGGQSFMLVPLQHLERCLGTITLVSAQPGYVFSEDELEFAKTLGLVTGAAVAKAQGYSRAQLSTANAERAAERAARLQALAAAFTETLTTDQVADVVVRQAVSALGARAGSLAVINEEGTAATVLRAVGYTSETRARWRSCDLSASLPMTDAIRDGEPLFLGSGAERLTRYPHLASVIAEHGDGALAVVPLFTEGRPFGAIELNFAEPRVFGEDDRSFVVTLSRLCALALERARLYESERRNRAHLALLAEASEILAQSLNYETTLQNVARIAAPRLADYCFFDLQEAEGDARRIAHAPGNAHFQQLLDGTRWIRSEREDINICALSSGKPGIHPDIDDAWMRNVATSEGHLALLRELQLSSLVTVPITDRGEVIGALTMCYALTSGRRHTRDDLRLAQELARRASAALENARLLKQAEEAIAHRDLFLSIASHELNTPLTTLLLQLRALQRKTFTPEGQKTRVDLAMKQTLRLTKLVAELLDVSRIAADRLRLEPEEFDAATIVRDAIERLAEPLSQSGSTIRLESDVNVPICADRMRFDQVLTNLLSNAIKYGDGKPIDVTLTSTAEQVQLVVRDHGIGIEAEKQRGLFQRFARAVSAKHYGGLGLGLWIVRQIIEAHGGRITLESQPGEGSTFTVSWPRSLPVAAEPLSA